MIVLVENDTVLFHHNNILFKCPSECKIVCHIASVQSALWSHGKVMTYYSTIVRSLEQETVFEEVFKHKQCFP